MAVGTTEIKYVDPLSLAKVSAAISAIIGLIVGLLLTILALPVLTIIAAAGFGGIGTGLGIASIVIFPITGGIGGFIGGAIIAVIYNFIAPRIGGIKINLG